MSTVQDRVAEKFILPNCDHDDAFLIGERKLSCVVEGWNGKAMTGHLVDFDPESRVLKIQGYSDPRPVALKFKQLKRLKIDVQPDTDMDFAPSDLPTLSNQAGLRSFVIHLKDGALFSGIAQAHRKLAYGLWIFPKRALEDDPFRIFIPAAGINRFEIKGSDGQALGDTGQDLVDFNDTISEEIATKGVEAALGAAAAKAEATASMVETPEQLAEALENQSRLKPVPIGEALLGLGKITADQLAQALVRQREKKSVPLGQTLVDMKLVTAADLQTAFARKMGYPFIDLKKFPIDITALRHVPVVMATRLKVLPIQMYKGAIVVAMPDPLQFKIIEELEFTTQRKIIPVVTVAADLLTRVAKVYRDIGASDSSIAPLERQGDPASGNLEALALAAELTGEPLTEAKDEPQIEQTDNTLVKLINSMIAEAYYQGASDIHIEPYPGREKVSIRFRVDGELRPYLELPSSYRSALVARIKVMCDLDISERRKPQDGKINFSKYGGLRIELRVATIPTTDGMEDVVMRILSSGKTVPLDALELSPHNRAAFESAIERPYGMLLCVGPTGSGKTTALHAALQRINKPNRKVWTAEDPVEITQRGLRQIQVNPRIGWTFATALRSLLRADPDVIMVGEIRDAETAEIAVEASLTGHLVLSTLHTNTAPETISRLTDLGVDPFSFADSLLVVMAQRLVRRLCKDCVQAAPLPEERLAELATDFQAPLPAGHELRDNGKLMASWMQRFGRNGRLTAYNAPGCEKCSSTGFKGRVAIHEMLVASSTVKRLIQTRARAEEIQQLAIAEGMRTLRQDGIEKVLQGLTTLAEVRSTSNA